MSDKEGKLYLVPTPIGNLKDITYRAVEILKQVEIILVEDTRITKKLLNHYQIKAQLISYHKFNEHKITEQVIDKLLKGIRMAMVSDAGTPGISDPGFLLIRTCIENGILIESLPGPTAFLPALILSGLPCDRFVFEGFLPQKKGRTKRLTELQHETRTMVFYESPFRIKKTIEQFADFFGNERKMSISREITKIYEETIRGSIGDILDNIETLVEKGEFVIVLEGKK
ncbi:16S rRNA (cytidine(1402)-2'-O)-methyltransferase [Bacteroidota bacterium]